MLRIDRDATFSRKVIARRPEGESTVEEPFKATYRVLSTDEMAGFDLTTAEGTRAMLVAAIVRLDEIADESGPVAYDEALRDRVLQLPYARAALFRTYVEHAAGARAGN